MKNILLFVLVALISLGAVVANAQAVDDCMHCKAEGGGLPGCECVGDKSCQCKGSGSSTVCTCLNRDGTGYKCFRDRTGRCSCEALACQVQQEDGQLLLEDCEGLSEPRP